jgi:hypothetical protein
MSAQRVKRSASATAATAIRFARVAANAAHSVPDRKILIPAAFAAMLAAAAFPLLVRADRPSVAANSTLKCYDSAGNSEPCVMRASASAPASSGRTTQPHQPPGWITTALYQEPSWAAPAVDQAANGTTNAPAQRHSTRLRRPAFACRGHVIPCFFSALRKGVTHLASVAAAQARPAREHL